MEADSNVVTRGKLAKTLGSNYERYVTLMKRWFTKEITKEEYDDELRTFLNPGQIRFHNKFILSVLSKCSSSILTSSPFILSELDLEPDIKKIKLEIDHKFKCLPQIDPHDYMKQVTSKTLQEELISKGFLNFLPDHDVVHARLMLHAWDHDLEGVEDDACKLIIEATYIFAKNILTAVISRRSGFKTKDKHFIEATEIVDQEEFVHVPKLKPSLQEAEEQIAFKLASSSKNTQILRSRPICVDDIIDTLMVSFHHHFRSCKVHPSIIPRYLMYSVNMEKFLLAKSHLSWEEIGEGKHAH
ncbi:hypothetical protein PGB90_002931 [Kerria lacca]